MTYSAPDAIGYARTRGSADEKLTGELYKVEVALGALEAGAIAAPGTVTTTAAPLIPGNANAFCLAWENPVAGPILIERVVVNLTAGGGTPAALGDFGTGATAATHADNLIDGMDLASTGITDNITGGGTHGKSTNILAEGEFVTGQILAQNAASLAGNAYISWSTI